MTHTGENSKVELEQPESLQAKAEPMDKKTFAFTQKLSPPIKKTFYGISHSLGEALTVLLGISFVWLYGLNFVIAKKDLNISFLDENISIFMSRAFEGEQTDIGRLKLYWNSAPNTLRFEATDIIVKNKDNNQIENLEYFSTDFSVPALANGTLDAIRVHIIGGKVTWHRHEDGRVIAGIGTPASIGEFGPVWERENIIFTQDRPAQSTPTQSGSTQSPNPPTRRIDFGTLESVIIAKATAYVIDEPTGLSLTFTDVSGEFAQIEDDYKFTLSSQLQQNDGQASIKLDLKTSPNLENVDFHSEIANINLHEFEKANLPYGVLRQLDAPLTLKANLSAKEGLGLEAIYASLDIKDGHLNLPDRRELIKTGSLRANYNPLEERLYINEIKLRGETLDVNAKATLRNIGTPARGFLKDEFGFGIDIADCRIDLSFAFDDPFAIKATQIQGTWNPITHQLNLEQSRIDFGNYALNTQANLSLSDNFKPTSLTLAGHLDGNLSPSELLHLWPTHSFLGARNWISRSIIDAEMYDVAYDVRIPEAVFQGDPVQNEHVNLNFKVRDGNVKYIQTMPPLLEASGQAILEGNRFTLDLKGGSLDDLTIEGGMINMPRLYPFGGDLIIDYTAQGPVQTMMSLIDQKPFEFARKYGVDPQEFSGQGRINMKITRPLLEKFDPSRIQYDVTGKFENTGAPFGLGGLIANKANVDLKIDRNGMEIKGPIHLGPWPSYLVWKETFDQGRTPTQYQLVGEIDQNLLDHFGFGFREYLGGTIPINITATGLGPNLSSADIEADLTKSDLRLWNYWHKPVGVAGKLRANVNLENESRFHINNLSITAPGLNIGGRLDMTADLRLIHFDLEPLNIDKFVNGAVTVAPDSTGSFLNMEIEGEYLDISNFVQDLFAGLQQGSTQNSFSAPLNINGNVDRLLLGENFTFNTANLSLFHNGSALMRANFDGQSPSGPFSVRLQPDEAQSTRRLELDIPDMSVPLRLFFGLNSLKQGRLTLDSTLPYANDNAPIQGHARLEDFTLANAPILAQMLSIPSFRGLSDTLSGDGIRFTKLNIPFSFHDGNLAMDEASASGPALGLTGNGSISFKDSRLDMDGVLIPAYQANSVLGNIPVLGTLLTGGKDQGVLGLNYSVRGPFTRTQVNVNPLSALTPGILRGIFSPNRNRENPDQTNDDPDNNDPDIEKKSIEDE